MSRLFYHEKSDRRKWAAVTIALLLIIAVIVTGVLTDWFTVWNKYCVFGHDYGEDGLCTRCGKEKPTPEPEQQPQSTTVAFAADSFNAAANSDKAILAPVGSRYSFFEGKTSDIVSSALTNTDLEYYQYNSSFNEKILINRQYVSKPGVVEIPKTEKLKIATSALQEYQSSNESSLCLHFKKLGSATWTRINNTNYEEDVGDDYVFLVSIINEYELTEFGVYSLYLLDDGLGKSDVITILYGVTDLPPEPTKTGYTFTGWYTDEACTEIYSQDYVTSDITLYAGFRANTYSITFNSNGGTGTMSNLAMTYDQSKTLTSIAFTRENYNFMGWATSADGAVVYSNGQSVNNLTSTNGAVIELFAVWELAQVTVTFEWDDNVLEESCIIGQAVELIEEPTKTGYVFLGWYTEDGELYDGQAITQDTTLVGRFEIIRCTVTFIVDGQVYAVYVCDYGTKLSEALSKSEVNTLLYTTGDEHSPNFQ